MSLENQLAALQFSVLPTWVYDHDRFRIRWANDEALKLWKARTIEELLARDFSDNSASTNARLENYLTALRRGARLVSEDWTLYPRGKPATMTLYGSGITLEDGRLAILFQAQLKGPDLDASMVRAVEALRHTSLMVSILDEQGGVIYHNPAALRALHEDTSSPVQTWLPDIADEMLNVVKAGHVYGAERTSPGERWHAVEARGTIDPVTGAKAVLVQQLDVTDRRRAEDLADARSQLLLELNDTLAVVESQRQQILSLSAPIIDVGQLTLAVPIIGDLSAERAAEVTRRLLPAAAAQRARFIILDLTGCAVIDEPGARSLLQLVQAIELLGARVIVTGVPPTLATALLQVGVDLSSLLTRRTLREGLEHTRRAIR
jgi:anti-anti-sigma regulatory factor